MIKVYLPNSNPNKVVQGSLGDIFYREGGEFFVIKSKVRSSLPITKIAFAFVLLGSSANPYKENEIAFKQPKETWIKKLKTNDSRTGWAFVGYYTPVVLVQNTPTPTPTPTPTASPTRPPPPHQPPWPSPTSCWISKAPPAR